MKPSEKEEKLSAGWHISTRASFLKRTRFGKNCGWLKPSRKTRFCKESYRLLPHFITTGGEMRTGQKRYWRLES